MITSLMKVSGPTETDPTWFWLSSGLPLIIEEFQHYVGKKFMKRAIIYYTQAFNKYGVDPILIVVGINSSSLDITQLAKRSRAQGCYSFLCAMWASECIILCHSSIDKCTLTESLDPFIAFGLFLTKDTASIIDMPWNDDKTIKLFYSLAIEHFEGVAGNISHLIGIYNKC